MKKSILFAVLALAGVAAAPITPSLAKKAEPLVALDTDKDGTIDANALNKSAEALFDKLDKDKDGTLAPKELQGRLSKKELKAADPDNEDTLTRDEFIGVAGNLLKSADPDNDGTLDAKELAAKPGRALLRLTH